MEVSRSTTSRSPSESILADDLLDRLDPRWREDRQQLKDGSLLLVEQLVAPLDRASEGALAGRQVTWSPAEELEAAPQPVSQLLGREQLQPRGRQLDRERQAVQACGDVRYRGGVLVGQDKARPRFAGALEEQADGLGRRGGLGRDLGRGDRGKGERGDGQEVLAADPERLSARHQNLELGAPLQQVRETLGCLHDLFEVVEQEQHPLPLEPLRQHLERLLVARPPPADRPNDGFERRVRVPSRREVDEVDAVLETFDLVGRRLEGEASLPDPARAGQRQQPHAGRVQEIPDHAQLSLPAQELGRLRRQVVRPAAQRRERGEIASERGMDELEDALRLEEVLQPVLAQVAEPCSLGQAAPRPARPRARRAGPDLRGPPP